MVIEVMPKKASQTLEQRAIIKTEMAEISGSINKITDRIGLLSFVLETPGSYEDPEDPSQKERSKRFDGYEAEINALNLKYDGLAMRWAALKEELRLYERRNGAEES